jgi:predicted nucleic acid-binding protein
MIYIDTSALAKRYIAEKGSERLHMLLSQHAVVATSRLTYAEILSAITRRHRAADVSIPDMVKVKKEFRADWERFTVVEVHAGVSQFVDRVIEKYALKASDSIHLSTALWLKHTTKQDLVFVASDIEILKRAKAERLEIHNPQE